MTINWFAIFGWAIALFIGNGILRNASKMDKTPKDQLVNQAFAIIVGCLIVVWIIVAIQRGS